MAYNLPLTNNNEGEKDIVRSRAGGGLKNKQETLLFQEENKNKTDFKLYLLRMQPTTSWLVVRSGDQ